MDQFASTPEPGYYAVIFSALRTEGDNGYGEAADRMEELAKTMPGYLGIESTRGPDGFGITVSYWSSQQAIHAWKAKAEHRTAQEQGKRQWYRRYELRIAKVERAYSGPAGR